MIRKLFLTIAAFCTFNSANAAIVSFDFEISPTVSGTISYDTSILPTSTVGNTASYINPVSGFIKLGGVEYAAIQSVINVSRYGGVEAPSIGIYWDNPEVYYASFDFTYDEPLGETALPSSSLLANPTEKYFILASLDGVQSGSDFMFVESGIAAVPEPATWLMLVLGFAGVGSTLRARRQAGDTQISFA